MIYHYISLYYKIQTHMHNHYETIDGMLFLDLDSIFDQNGKYIDDHEKYKKLKSIKIILFRTQTHPIKIGNGFLSRCSNLTSIDLSPLSNVTSTGNRFLSNCSNLTSIDLSPLSNVTSIRNGFLNGCSKLESIDLSPLSNVTSIGDWFLSNCSNLTSIDLSPFSNVTSIGNFFLSGCSNLTTIIINDELNEQLNEQLNNEINKSKSTIVHKNSNYFNNYHNDLEKLKNDKKFAQELFKYLTIPFNKKRSHEQLLKQLKLTNKHHHKKMPINKLPICRNEYDIFTFEEIKNIPLKKLVFIEKINDTYNAFDVMQLRKHIFDKKKNEYNNPLTTNKICEEDLEKILKVNTRQIIYFIN